MVILLGASGYMGQAFGRELDRRGWRHRTLSRSVLDYTRFDLLVKFLREVRPDFLINAAGFTGRPNVDACETARAETIQGNTLFPLTVAQACLAAGVPWGHVSSGCIYSGAWVVEPGGRRLETDLTRPEIRTAALQGFVETDEPNFSFHRPPCSFYSGCKQLGEEAIAGLGSSYIWRLRIPFDEHDEAKNYLTKLQRYTRVYDNLNSLSHRGDFARACLDLWERRAPLGVYHVTNPGFVSARQVVGLIEQVLKPARAFEFFANDEEFYRVAAQTPRSNCVLDVSKLLATGVRMRPVEEAVVDSLRHWQPA